MGDYETAVAKLQALRLDDGIVEWEFCTGQRRPELPILYIVQIRSMHSGYLLPKIYADGTNLVDAVFAAIDRWRTMIASPIEEPTVMPVRLNPNQSEWATIERGQSFVRLPATRDAIVGALESGMITYEEANLALARLAAPCSRVPVGISLKEYRLLYELADERHL